MPLLLAGCDGVQREEVATAPATPVAKAPIPEPTPSPPARKGTVPAAVVVSTNEPFYQARVEGAVIRLTGAAIADRSLAVVERSGDTDARRWMGRDAIGSVTVRVSARPCEDDMSGAQFPMTGSIDLGHGSVSGCARPTGTPPPRPAEETVTLPAAFRGTWAPDQAACAPNSRNVERLVIGPATLRFHESVGRLTAVELRAPSVARVTAAYAGEGEQWTATHVLRLADRDRQMVVEGEGFRAVKAYCG